MSWIAVGVAVVSVVGAGVSYVGQQQAADAAEQTAAYNARLQREQAAQDSQVAAENARRKEDENNRYLAAQRAALAANGLALEGTPLAVLGETSTTLERDILDMGFDAQNRQRQFIASANLSIFEGQSQAGALRTQSYGTLISGVASAVGSYGKASGSFSGSKSTTGRTSSFLG